MYRRIVLAYDGSREARSALREGALLAKAFGSRVYLLCVVANSTGIGLADAVHPGIASQYTDKFQPHFQEAMDRLRRLGLKPSGRIEQGEPTQIIGAYAREVGADLIVVGHRKQNFIERWWAGSSGALLLDTVGCSVLASRGFVSDEEFFGAMETPARRG